MRTVDVQQVQQYDIDRYSIDQNTQLSSLLMSKRRKSVKKPPKLHKNQATVSKPSLKKRKQQDTAARRKLAPGDKVPKSTAGPQYHESQQILCVGEGNFSFARALVRTLEGQGQNLTATAYDARDTVDAKYQVSHRHKA